MIVHRLKPAATTDLKGLLVRASSGVFAVNAVGSLCLLGAHFLIARLFGSETYGQYVYVLNWVALLSLLGMLGFDTATLRFVPEYRAKGEAALLGGYLKSSAAFVLAASLGVSALLAAAVWWVDPGPSLKAAFLVGCLMLPLYTGMQLRCAQIQAFNRAALAQVPQRILRPVLFVAVAGVAVFLLSAKLSAARLLLVETAIVGGLFLLTWGISGRIAAGERPTETSALPRDWIRTSASLLFISGVFVILNRSDVIMIGFLIDTLHAGIYSAAARMGELMLFTLTAVNAVVAPHIHGLP
jgi:O-antigen/teichoic acid export membrane protein